MSESIYDTSEDSFDTEELPRAWKGGTSLFEFCDEFMYRVEFKDGSVGWWPEGHKIPRRIFRDWDFRKENLTMTVVNVR